MRTTLEIEMEFSTRSYMDLVKTAGMRRRTLIACATGLFTQWSGNTLTSYYLSTILDRIGITDSIMKQRINLTLSCWSLICAVVIVWTCVNMSRVKAAYMCTGGMLAAFVAWTISMQQSMHAVDNGGMNDEANVSVLVFVFLYKPAYQIFFNALVFSKWLAFLYSPCLSSLYVWY